MPQKSRPHTLNVHAGTSEDNVIARALRYSGRRHERQRRHTFNALAASAEESVQSCIVAGKHPHTGALPGNAAEDADALVQLLQRRGLKVRAGLHCG